MGISVHPAFFWFFFHLLIVSMAYCLGEAVFELLLPPAKIMHDLVGAIAEQQSVL